MTTNQFRTARLFSDCDPAFCVRNAAKFYEMSETLAHYLRNIVGGLTPAAMIVPFGELSILAHDQVSTIVLQRNEVARCQTELVLMHPKAPLWDGEHRHPQVESVEVELYSCEGCSRNGVIVPEPDFVFLDRNCVYLAPTDWHGVAVPKPFGSALLSVQRWLGDVPMSSVGLNWEGKPVGPSHGAQQRAIMDQDYYRYGG